MPAVGLAIRSQQRWGVRPLAAISARQLGSATVHRLGRTVTPRRGSLSSSSFDHAVPQRDPELRGTPLARSGLV